MVCPLFIGIDFGTSGARACVMAPHGEIEDLAGLRFAADGDGGAATAWREALLQLIAEVPAGLRKRLAALAIDATSATVLACDDRLQPLHPPLMYHDARAQEAAQRIARAAGPAHPAAMPSSGLAKVLWLQDRLAATPVRAYLNQADWLTALLTGRTTSDRHNALKMGLDAASGHWPAWLSGLVPLDRLPAVLRPGDDIGPLLRARHLGVNPDCRVRAGTTDSIAAFLATGAQLAGDAVTALGSTLALKLVSHTRVDDARHGVYSHWFGDHRWLAGGASNAGGSVLRQHFDDAELAALSAGIDPEQDSALDYYPLPRAGERFPINDPDLPPRLAPQPASRAAFLHGLLQGLARIEAAGYARLIELGATPPTRVLSTGGGAHNPTFTRIRARCLNLPVSCAAHHQACYGSARLAALGVRLFTGDRHD